MKIDLHIHTKYSIDSVSEPEMIMKYAIRKGMNGVAVTDHDNSNGWEDMTNAGNKFRMKVVLGEEIKVKWEGKKFEVMGLFLNERIRSRELYEVLDQIKSQDGIVCLPHPFDIYKGMRGFAERLVKLVDAVEVFNARCFSLSHNKKAFNFAEKHDLGMTAGSDAHTEQEVGNAYVVANADDLEDLRKEILDGKVKTIGCLTHPSIRIWSWLNQGMSVFRNI